MSCVGTDPDFDISNKVSVATGCEISVNEDQDFLNTDPITVNADAFFGFSDWVFEGKLNEEGNAFDEEEQGLTGSFDLSSLFDSPSGLMLIFKSGGGTTLVGYTISALTGSWDTPFVCPPFFSNRGECNGFPKEVSHISVYSRDAGDTSVIPLPAAGWLLLAGVGGLAAMARRRKVAA